MLRKFEKYSNDELINGISNNDREILSFIYEKHRPKIISNLDKKGCCRDKANDYFQDAMYKMYREIKNDNLVIRKSFYSYLHTVCTRIWIVNNIQKDEIVSNTEKLVNDEFILSYEECCRYKLYRKYFVQLRGRCREIIELVLKGHFYHVIATMMGYKDETVARTKHSACKGYLIRSIKASPEYKKITTCQNQNTTLKK